MTQQNYHNTVPLSGLRKVLSGGGGVTCMQLCVLTKESMKETLLIGFTSIHYLLSAESRRRWRLQRITWVGGGVRLCYKNTKCNSRVTDYSLDDRGSIPSRNGDFPQRPDRLWNPRSRLPPGLWLPHRSPTTIIAPKLMPVALPPSPLMWVLVQRELCLYLNSTSNKRVLRAVPNLFVHKGSCQKISLHDRY
jgi:hypothetical protein